MMVEPIQPNELRDALAFVLAPPGATTLAAMSNIVGFERYLQQTQAAWLGRRIGPARRPSAVFLSLLLPGRSAVALPAAPGVLGIDPEAQFSAGKAMLRDLALHTPCYVQALLERADSSRRAALERLHFEPLTSLAYLERDADFPWMDAPGEHEAAWISYSAETHPRFVDVVGTSYVDTHDCPELATLRTVEDALLSHRCTGTFDAARWEVMQIEGADAGVLLFARHLDWRVGEIVYVGLVPTFRQRGLAMLLLRRALHHCRALRLKRLMLVVDVRNAPAKKLYERFGLTEMTVRDAVLLRNIARE